MNSNEDTVQILWSIRKVTRGSSLHQPAHARGWTQTKILFKYYDRFKEWLEIHHLIHEHLREDELKKRCCSNILIDTKDTLEAQPLRHKIPDKWKIKTKIMSENPSVQRRSSEGSSPDQPAHVRGWIEMKILLKYHDRFEVWLKIYHLIQEHVLEV